MRCLRGCETGERDVAEDGESPILEDCMETEVGELGLAESFFERLDGLKCLHLGQTYSGQRKLSEDGRKSNSREFLTDECPPIRFPSLSRYARSTFRI